jgi:hypothetical protein
MLIKAVSLQPASIYITMVTPVAVQMTACARESRSHDTLSSSLSDLKEIGCKSVGLVHISPLFQPTE